MRMRRRSTCTGARDSVVVDDAGSAVLVLDALPPLPAGKTYQAWVITDNTPVSAGVFAPTDDAPSFRFPSLCLRVRSSR